MSSTTSDPSTRPRARTEHLILKPCVEGGGLRSRTVPRDGHHRLFFGSWQAGHRALCKLVLSGERVTLTCDCVAHPAQDDNGVLHCFCACWLTALGLIPPGPGRALQREQGLMYTVRWKRVRTFATCSSQQWRMCFLGHCITLPFISVIPTMCFQRSRWASTADYGVLCGRLRKTNFFSVHASTSALVVGGERVLNRHELLPSDSRSC